MFCNSACRRSMCEHGVNVCARNAPILLLVKEKKTWRCLPAVRAAGVRVRAHPHTHAHSGSWSPARLSWKLRSPALTTSPLLKLSSTLRDTLQSVHLEPSARDPMAGTVTGGGTNPAGAKWRLGKAAGASRLPHTELS